MSIKFEKVDYIYSPGTTMEKRGLDNVSFELADNKFIALETSVVVNLRLCSILMRC